MASPTFRAPALRQVLRRVYPHRAMAYARQRLHDRVLGPVSLAKAIGVLETFVYSLVPREAQGMLQFLLGLNTELCQAGPVSKSRPASQARMARRHGRGASH